MGSDPDTTARRKAMAEAIRRKEAEIIRRPAWPGLDRYMELAMAADEARDKFEEEQTK